MAENIRQKLVHLHTSEKKAPTKDILELGEIAVQHNDTEAALYIKKNNGEIAKFIDASAVDTKINVEKTRAEGAEAALDAKIGTLSGSSHTHANKTVLDGIDADKVTAWDAAKADAISSSKTYTDNTIAALKLADTYEAKGTAQGLIDGLKLAETYASKEVETKISTLIGDDTDKSVRSVASEEVAKIVNSADTRYDTLKEIADWIISDTTGAASMANDITALKAISADTRLVKLEAISGESHTHNNKALLDTYTQTESDLKDAVAKKHAHDNKAVLDKITDAKVTDWDAAEGNAKKYTDSVASGKANTVHTHAITDVTGLQGALDGKAASAHTHAIANVTGLQDALNGKAASAHTHAIADVTGLQAALDEKDSNGAAAQALKDAKAYSDGNLATAKSYADGLAVNYDAAGAANTALDSAKTYTDEKLKTLRIDCGIY